MLNTKTKFTSLITGVVLSIATFNPVAVFAGPLSTSLPNSPLILQTSVKPNILTLIDDSGSMDIETMISGTNNGVYYSPDARRLWTGGPRGYAYSHPASPQIYSRSIAPSEQFFLNDGSTDALAELAGIWRIWNSQYNKMYYDPTINYTPWVGIDSSTGFAYADAPVADVAKSTGSYNSYWKGDKNNIPGFWAARYYKWDDKNGNKVVDELYDAADRAANLVEITNPGTYEGGPDRDDCVSDPGAPNVCTYDEEIQNFANWFKYYRKRDYVVKRALSDIFSSNQNRVGLATIHEDTAVSTPVRDLTVSTNRAQLIENLFDIDPGGGTPLRIALREAGQYYQSGGNIMPSGNPSPILPAGGGGECQQNYTLLMTDGYWNGSSPGVGNRDKDGGSGNNNTIYDGGSHADDVSDTLADVAMKYYEIDLNTSLANQVPQNGDDNNPAQHMVTYGVSFGLTGDIPDGQPVDRATPPSPNWPDPVTANTAETIDDLRHAAWNGRGEFLSAANPKQLIDGLTNAFQSIQGRTGGAASVSFSEAALQAGTKVFQVEFDSNDWSGDLKAFLLNSGGTLGAQVWSAETQLAALVTPTSDSRKIFTYNDSTNTGVAFSWGSLSAKQKSDLNAAAGDAQTEVLPYLRGATGDEGGLFRNRGKRLGDIIRSTPAFVTANPTAWPDDNAHNTGAFADYHDFVITVRTSAIYVGSNDGMLHGFNANTGDELMAYIPNALFSSSAGEGLHALTDKNYKHRHYVDGSPTVVDARIGGGSGAAAWKTVLVSGLRGGGRSYFALDVTNPANFDEANPTDTVLWEFTSDDDPDGDLGYTYGEASIVPAEDGNWYAIFGNGYNSDRGRAVLYMVRLDHNGAWSAGDFYKISVDSADNTTNRNGLATPVVIDKDGNGKSDTVYAGDLKGGLYAFDITNPASITKRKVFQTQSNQPITSAPVVAKHPSESAVATSPNTLIMFGTGQYLVVPDMTTTDTQSFYGVWDKGSATAATTANLVEQTLSNFTSGGNTVRLLTQNDVGYSADSPPTQGWYFDLGLGAAGERMVVRPILRGNDIWFVTTIPDPAPCGNQGSGFLMVADARTGGSPQRSTFDINGDGQVDGEDLFFDTNGDGIPDFTVQDLIDSPQDLDGDGNNDNIVDLDGDGSVSIEEAIYQLGQLGVTDQLIAPVGAQQSDSVEGFALLSDTAYITLLGGLQQTAIAPVTSDPIDRLSWEELR
ncbi:MAG TPA: hypothetical protein EYH06_12180 [Chromatiales bacterium]|nr:hypothetical protein [Thiotrichales bacterium]HIP69321.1 hypothetical protein [Chromatiales bacterium]